MSISLICAFQCEVESFKPSLLSWLQFKEINEIVIVYFNPHKHASNNLTSLDNRVKLIQFSGQDTFNKSELLNLAASICSSEYILKLDEDSVLDSKLNLSNLCNLNEDSFVCGKDFENTSQFDSLKGLLYLSKENLLKTGGFNESKLYFGHENDELVHRLELLGLKHQPLLSEIKEFYLPTDTTWNLTQLSDRNFIVEKNIFKNKLANFPRTYYMSLEESGDRQEFMERQFAEYGIKPYKVISKRHSQCNDVVTGKYAHTINEGTTGCIISHLKSIKHWYDNFEDEYALFCEDDLSLETVKYWDFTWEDFMKTLPNDWDAVQLLVIREDFGDFQLRERYWDDWAAAAYIMRRDCAKRIIDTYIREDSYHLELPNSESMPLNENILFSSVGKTYSVPLFVEAIQFQSTYVGKDDDVVDGQKKNHYIAYELVLNYWKNKNTNQPIKTDLEELLTQYSVDTENPIRNFNLGVWYENNQHTAPALSYYLRCAERTDDNDLAYESLIRASYCYDKQGTRDGSAKSLLEQALCLLPKRPEAYYLLSRFAERREWWQDCYIYAEQGLMYADLDSKPLRTNVEYLGRSGFLFEKSIAAWWWGKSEEAKSLALEAKNNNDLPASYMERLKSNLKTMGINF